MKFIKSNFHNILKLYINQIGITIFALMLYTACGATDDSELLAKLRTVVSVFSICFYYVLIYYVAWDIGANDKIRIDGGRLAPNKAKGALLSLIANVPNLFLSLLTVLFGFVYIGGAENIAALFGIFQMVTMLHASMYMGIIQTMVYGFTTVDNVPIDQKYLVMPILFIVIPLVSVLLTHVAYTLGSHDKKLLSVFSSKNK